MAIIDVWSLVLAHLRHGLQIKLSGKFCTAPLLQIAVVRTLRLLAATCPCVRKTVRGNTPRVAMLDSAAEACKQS